MPSLYFEDFAVGQTFQTSARTVTEADVVAFAGLSGDFNAIHTDAEFARASPLGQRIAHAALGIAFVTGLTARLGIFDRSAVQFIGMDWRFLSPILIGDTVHCTIAIAAKEDGPLPDRGTLIREVELLKHDGTVAQRGTSTMVVLRRRD